MDRPLHLLWLVCGRAECFAEENYRRVIEHAAIVVILSYLVPDMAVTDPLSLITCLVYIVQAWLHTPEIISGEKIK